MSSLDTTNQGNMIEITIKTLDSRNHAFTVGDELTVKQLKEHIAEPVNVPAESQRLIYCGRVLLDDKKLSEYDVHGKVIHLVQRAPPGSPGTGNTGNEGRNNTNPTRRPWRTVISPGGRVDGGNAMYLGAMAFPADLMDAQVFDLGITMPQPRHGLSQSRLSVARTMLRRARYTLQNLENPTHQESPAEVNSNQVITLAESIFIPGHVDQVVPRDELVIPPRRDLPPPPPEPTIPPTDDSASQQTPGGINNGGARSRYPGTAALAELVMQMREVNRRLQPFLDQYYELMRDDPVLESPTDAQRIFGQVSEMMHFMAHAYHALSDVMCDFTQPPPRFLRCRPVLIQHSAVLQTGIPIQAQFNLSTTPSSQQQGSTQSQGTTTTESGTSETSPTPASTAPSAEETTPVREEAVNSSQPAQAQAQPQTPAGLNLGSGNFEFYMDVGPSSITIDSVEATVVTSAGTSSTEPTGIATGSFPWGSPPTPEFIQNLMQALAGQIIGPGGPGGAAPGGGASGGGGAAAGGAAAAAATTASGNGANAASTQASTEGASPAPGAAAGTNSQARGNTATHPTTATQTRSTSRPHVHFAPGIQVREHNLLSSGMGGQTFFDPFLPCNSHHIRGSRRRGTGQGAEQQGEPQDQAGQSTSTPNNTESPPRGPQNPETVYDLLSGVLGAAAASRQSGRQSGQGQGHSVIRILPRDITILLQGPQIQGLSNIPSGATVAELLQGLPDHSYTEGQSLFMDLFMVLARNLRVTEVLNMGTSTSNLLINLRPVLSQFVRERLLQGRDPSPEAMSEAVDRINAELRPFMESISDVPMREDVDLVTTINQLNHRTFPLLMSDVLEGDDARYSQSIPELCNNYARTVVLILLHCSQNGQQGLEPIFAALARRMIIGVPNAFQNWSVSQIVSQLRTLTNDNNSENVQQYLVYRIPETPATPEVQPPSEPVPTNPAPPAPIVPMEIEDETEMHIPSIQEPEPLPDVIIGAEPWHNGLPPEWVPIITRDSERQRRQAVQGPLSEAYLSGMPSKRRKVVTSAKPHGTLARVISESMATALGAAGVGSVEGVAETAGADTSLRAAYREQVRTTVEATLRSHPDYKPDKYPNAAKYFDRK